MLHSLASTIIDLLPRFFLFLSLFFRFPHPPLSPHLLCHSTNPHSTPLLPQTRSRLIICVVHKPLDPTLAAPYPTCSNPTAGSWPTMTFDSALRKVTLTVTAAASAAAVVSNTRVKFQITQSSHALDRPGNVDTEYTGPNKDRGGLLTNFVYGAPLFTIPVQTYILSGGDQSFWKDQTASSHGCAIACNTFVGNLATSYKVYKGYTYNIAPADAQITGATWWQDFPGVPSGGFTAVKQITGIGGLSMSDTGALVGTVVSTFGTQVYTGAWSGRITITLDPATSDFTSSVAVGTVVTQAGNAVGTVAEAITVLATPTHISTIVVTNVKRGSPSDTGSFAIHSDSSATDIMVGSVLLKRGNIKDVGGNFRDTFKTSPFELQGVELAIEISVRTFQVLTATGSQHTLQKSPVTDGLYRNWVVTSMGGVALPEGLTLYPDNGNLVGTVPPTIQASCPDGNSAGCSNKLTVMLQATDTGYPGSYATRVKNIQLTITFNALELHYESDDTASEHHELLYFVGEKRLPRYPTAQHFKEFTISPADTFAALGLTLDGHTGAIASPDKGVERGLKRTKFIMSFEDLGNVKDATTKGAKFAAPVYITVGASVYPSGDFVRAGSFWKPVVLKQSVQAPVLAPLYCGLGGPNGFEVVPGLSAGMYLNEATGQSNEKR